MSSVGLVQYGTTLVLKSTCCSMHTHQ